MRRALGLAVLAGLLFFPACGSCKRADPAAVDAAPVAAEPPVPPPDGLAVEVYVATPDADEQRKLALAMTRRAIQKGQAERARREGIVLELVRGTPENTIDLTARHATIAKLRGSWLRRAWGWLVARVRRHDFVDTRGMGRLTGRQHEDMVRFARDSGNEAMLECLRAK